MDPYYANPNNFLKHIKIKHYKNWIVPKLENLNQHRVFFLYKKLFLKNNSTSNLILKNSKIKQIGLENSTSLYVILVLYFFNESRKDYRTAESVCAWNFFIYLSDQINCSGWPQLRFFISHSSSSNVVKINVKWN